MDTYFAPAERSDDAELRKKIEFLSKNSIIDGLLHSVSGLLAILNGHRQILAINDLMMNVLKIDSAERIWGLRPGEALKCIHAYEMPGGCGTSRYCSTCGAAISIVISLTTNKPTERECALIAEESGHNKDLYFRVRCVPVTFGQERLLLLFLQDITYHQRLSALERVFFHDINGIVQGILLTSELISMKADEETRELAQTLSNLSSRLAGEISIQRCLSQTGECFYQPVFSDVLIITIFQEIGDIFINHPLSKNKSLKLPEEIPSISIKTEPSLLIRVLSNMITNAFEGTSEEGEVRVWIESSENELVFCVWNEKSIPSDIAKRIFQRNFSTKATIGRGLGTYSMKLFGENILGGRVNFTTSEKDGTIFRLTLML